MKIDIMNGDKNLPLRTEIVEIALNIEQQIDLILITNLTIDSEKRKGVTNKSGGLSFKNKIDLLFDLYVFDEDEHRLYLLLMEFRNQFLHNVHCSSFVYAADILGDDKRKRLLKFSDTNGDIENKLNNAYKNLYRKSLDIALNKLEKRKDLIEKKIHLIYNLNSNTIYFIDVLFGLCQTLFEKFELNNSDSPEILKLKVNFQEIIKEEIDKITSSQQYIELQDKLHESLQPDKLKSYFK